MFTRLFAGSLLFCYYSYQNTGSNKNCCSLNFALHKGQDKNILFNLASLNDINYILSFKKMCIEIILLGKFLHLTCARSFGVMVSTLDFESSDPSSNLGGTLHHNIFIT